MILLPQKNEINKPILKNGPNANRCFLLILLLIDIIAISIAAEKNEIANAVNPNFQPSNKPITAAYFTSPIPILSTLYTSFPKYPIIRKIENNIIPPIICSNKLFGYRKITNMMIGIELAIKRLFGKSWKSISINVRTIIILNKIIRRIVSIDIP